VGESIVLPPPPPPEPPPQGGCQQHPLSVPTHNTMAASDKTVFFMAILICLNRNDPGYHWAGYETSGFQYISKT
jgi:hypothetical protein